MKKIVEKKHRLDLKNYTGLARASFALCIKNRTPIFTNNRIVDCFVEILKIAIKKHHCSNWAYVFMPDHLHIVLEGTSENSNLWKAIVLFKQKTGFYFSKKTPGIHWQKDFYDHVHKTEHELINHILYVVNNPVRKKMVLSWQEYPFTGSLDSDLNSIIWN